MELSFQDLSIGITYIVLKLIYITSNVISEPCM